MKKKITVHVADDHKILIDGVIALLNTDDSIAVEGYSLTGREVVKWYEKNKTDVLVLDINMPELDGIEVLKIFRKRKIKQKIIILSGLSDPKIVQEMIGLGASGFIEKGNANEHIIEGIKSVYEGKIYYSNDIKNALFELYINDVKTEETIKNVVDDTLTDREIDVLVLITEECSTSEMAEKLNISAKTVESHRRSLYKKIKVKNVVGLAMYAVKNNIV